VVGATDPEVQPTNVAKIIERASKWSFQNTTIESLDCGVRIAFANEVAIMNSTQRPRSNATREKTEMRQPSRLLMASTICALALGQALVVIFRCAVVNNIVVLFLENLRPAASKMIV
jgi:hypothetical protein